jgi:hypothetical protein
VPVKPPPMRLVSVYTFSCAHCGAGVVTASAEGVCVCGVRYRIDWQAPYRPPDAPPPSPSSLEAGQ